MVKLFASIVNWFVEIGKILLAISALIFLSGVIMIYHNREIILDCKNNQVFYQKGKLYLFGQYVQFVLCLLFALAMNAVFCHLLYKFIITAYEHYRVS